MYAHVWMYTCVYIHVWSYLRMYTYTTCTYTHNLMGKCTWCTNEYKNWGTYTTYVYSQWIPIGNITVRLRFMPHQLRLFYREHGCVRDRETKKGQVIDTQDYSIKKTARETGILTCICLTHSISPAGSTRVFSNSLVKRVWAQETKRHRDTCFLI